MPVRKKPSPKARPKAAKKARPTKVAKKAPPKKAAARTRKTVARKPAAGKTKPATGRPTTRASAAKTRPVGRGAAGAKKKKAAAKPGKKRPAPAAKRLGGKKPAPGVLAPRRSAAKTVPLRRPLTGTPIPNRARSPLDRSEDRITPLVNRAPVETVPEVAGFRPSRILTTRPRPVIRQVDPSGVDSEPPRTLQPWEIEVDDLAELMAARAAEEKAAEEEHARFVTSPASAEARIDEARAAGWTADARPTRAGLRDARVRLVHPHCKFIDGALVREVALSVHKPSGRATLLLEGGPRLRTASWRMREEEDLPAQVRKLIDDPARLARAEHASAQDLLAELEALDRAVVSDLRRLADGAAEALVDRLRVYVAAFAATHAAFGLPATVDGVWERFGVRRDCVLERLGLAEEGRRAVADAFDVALDSA